MVLSCLPGASLVPQIDPFLAPWCLASCPILSCFPGASQAVQMVLSCLPGASLSKALLCSKWPFKGQSVLRAAGREAHPRICREPGRSPLKLYYNSDKIRRPSETGIRSVILCYERAFKGKPVPREGQRLPGASQAPWSFPVSLLPPWCLPGCPNGSFLPLVPPWCLAGCPIPWCLPGSRRLSNGSFPASLVPRKLSNESFPASLVPLRLSKWSFPASLVPPCDRQSPREDSKVQAGKALKRTI